MSFLLQFFRTTPSPPLTPPLENGIMREGFRGCEIPLIQSMTEFPLRPQTVGEGVINCGEGVISSGEGVFPHYLADTKIRVWEGESEQCSNSEYRATSPPPPLHCRAGAVLATSRAEKAGHIAC